MCDTKGAVLGSLAAVPFLWPALPFAYLGWESAESQNKVKHRQEKAINLDAKAKQNMLVARKGQEEAAASEKKDQVTLATEAAISDSAVSTGEAGIGGGSVRDISRTILNRRLAGISSIDRNADNTQTQLGFESVSVEAGRRRAVGSLPGNVSEPLAGAQMGLQALQTVFSLAGGISSFTGGGGGTGEDISRLENIA